MPQNSFFRTLIYAKDEYKIGKNRLKAVHQPASAGFQL
jgi:hypothetical protein